MSILDDVRPLGEMKGMMPGTKRMAFGGQSSLSEPPPVSSTPTMDLVPRFKPGGQVEDKYRNLSEKEMNQLLDYIEEFNKYMFPNNDLDLDNDKIYQFLDEIQRNTYGDKLMAQYNKNMNGGIMGGNTQGGFDGIPKKFNI